MDAHLVGKNRFECRTCPYQFVLDKRYYERRALKGKDVDDILGDDDGWGRCETTEVQCKNEKCDNTEAKFYQMQIRSADEPMTNFYKVCFVGSVGLRDHNTDLLVVHQVQKRVERMSVGYFGVFGVYFHGQQKIPAAQTNRFHFSKNFHLSICTNPSPL
jgi:DNA-directed RNA polymerase III subunit RPC11